MNRLTNEQRLQIIEFYYQNDCSVRKVHRALLPFYGQFNRPTEAAIRALVTKFRTKFTLLDIKPPTRLRRVQTEDNFAAVSASVNDDHQLSIRRRSQQLGLSYSSTRKILEQLKMPCKGCDKECKCTTEKCDERCKCEKGNKCQCKAASKGVECGAPKPCSKIKIKLPTKVN